MTEREYGTAYQDGYFRTVRLLRCRGASTEQAEDVAQAAWLQGWQKLTQLRDERLIIGWINTIAVNYFRRSGPYEARFAPLPEFALYGNTGINSAALDVAKILSNCRPRDRSLFELLLIGLTTQEIAEQAGVSATAIRLRLLRARRDARTKLDDRASALREAFLVRAAAA